MRYISILPLIILIVILSGCVGQDKTPVTSAKDGVIITDFSFENSPIYTRDNVGLELEIQNVGGNKAILKKIQIYGVDFTTGTSTERYWSIIDGVQELNEKYIKDNLAYKGELYQPDPDINLEGAKDYYRWKLQAPSDVVSQTNYDFKVRVEYNYETAYSGIIRIISDDYLQTLSEEEKQKLFTSGGLISSELTNGPISVTPYSGRHFIVSPNENVENRTMKFKIENVGKGYPYIDDINTNKYYMRIKNIEGDSNIIVNCSEEDWTFKLSSGKSHTIECKFKPPTDVVNKIDKQFQITFEYSYYVDGSASITVKPSY